ncbi:hypothetical protein EDB83DRAFT_2331208 [Lactarius deliciosus]|nr:hypothetical protein EDB83DRAFT_2331208 [Lactarius deliciosus]
MSSESEESVLAVLTTAQVDSVVEEMSPVPGQSCKAKTPEQPPPPPQPSMHSVMRVDSPSPSTSLTVRAKAKTQPKPQSPGYDPNNEEANYHLGYRCPHRRCPKLVALHIPLTTAHVSVSSSPSRRRDTPAGASTGSPPVPVRGTLYSGPLGLWKNFYKAATDKPVSAPGSSRGIVPHSEERVKKKSDTLRPESPSKIVSLSRPSLSWKKPVGTKPAQSSVPNHSVTDICPLSQCDESIDLSFPQKVYYARDIPHSHYRKSIMAKDMFEAVIVENTFEDEPNAPHISIVNDVDGDQEEVTPAWEFHYSNHIWHSDDVPPPDLVNLRGCDCKGHCDPKSQTSMILPGFIYDEKGRLKRRGYPIFECNDLCGCLDDCRNRVIQRGRQYTVNIRKTTNKGWGTSMYHLILLFLDMSYRYFCWETKDTKRLIYWYIRW